MAQALLKTEPFLSEYLLSSTVSTTAYRGNASLIAELEGSGHKRSTNKTTKANYLAVAKDAAEPKTAKMMGFKPAKTNTVAFIWCST